MEQKAAHLDMYHFTFATDQACSRVEEAIKRAEKFKTDPDKEKRLEVHKCIACFYTSFIGGAAMTNRPCGSCGDPQMYGSTATDELCLGCAKKHQLCKRCAGDIDMNPRRRKWPKLIEKKEPEPAEPTRVMLLPKRES